MQKHTIPPYLSKVREKETLALTTELFLDCKRYQSHEQYVDPLLNTWCQGLETLIKSSEKGFEQLLNDKTQRLMELNNLFVAKFRNGWISDEH